MLKLHSFRGPIALTKHKLEGVGATDEVIGGYVNIVSQIEEIFQQTDAQADKIHNDKMLSKSGKHRKLTKLFVETWNKLDASYRRRANGLQDRLSVQYVPLMHSKSYKQSWLVFKRPSKRGS